MTRKEKMIETLKDRETICRGIAEADRKVATYHNGAYDDAECVREARYYEGKADAFRIAWQMLEMSEYLSEEL